MSESYSNRQTTVTGGRLERTIRNNVVVSSKTTTQARLTTTMTRVSNNLPGYHSRVSSGQPLPWTQFTFNKETRLYPFGTESWDLGEVYTLDGVIGYSQEDPLLSAPADDSLILQTEKLASQKLLANIKSQKLNMGTFLAESGKSMNMIAQTATKFYQAYSAVRHGKLAEAAGHLGIAPSRRRQRRFNRTAKKDLAKAQASAWLELQYGWKPLLMDTYNAAQEIADNVSPIFVGHAYGKHVETRSSVKQYSVTNYTYAGTNTEVANSRCEVKTSCTFTMENTVARRAALNGLSNPLMVAWEIVPYSFVVDWFYPIGDYLSRIDATNGLSFHSGGIVSYYHQTTSRKRVIQGKLKRVSDQSVDILKISRGPLGSFPSNTVPSFKNPLSLGHAANAVALLINFWK